MKAITITIPEELDREAAAEAKRRGISKSELIRQGLRAVIPDEPERGPYTCPPDKPWLKGWYEMAGFADDVEGLRPGETIDDVVYGER